MSKKDKEYKKQIKAEKAENWKTYLRLAEKNLDKSREKHEYAIKQFDTLMIALSTAALGFTSNYIKDELTTKDLFWARTSQILFLICLLSNLFSHLFSLWAHNVGVKRETKEFELDSYGEDHVLGYSECQQFKWQSQRKIYNIIVRVFNILAFSALILGIVSFIYYTFTS